MGFGIVVAGVVTGLITMSENPMTWKVLVWVNLSLILFTLIFILL